MFAAWLRTQPLRVQGVAIALIILANHAAAALGLTLGGLCETAIDVAAVLAATEITRRHVTPTPKPRAAVPPAHQETRTMNAALLVAAFQGAASKFVAGIQTLDAEGKSLLAALPENFKHPALDALQAGVDDLTPLVATAVEADAPPSLQSAIQAGFADAKAEFDAKVAKLNDAAATLGLQPAA